MGIGRGEEVLRGKLSMGCREGGGELSVGCTEKREGVGCGARGGGGGES